MTYQTGTSVSPLLVEKHMKKFVHQVKYIKNSKQQQQGDIP